MIASTNSSLTNRAKNIARETITVDQEYAGQRIDNFLFTQVKGIPKSRWYRALRNGEVRVNKKRVKADYRIQTDDTIRLPPLRMAVREKAPQAKATLLEQLEQAILFEDNNLIIINKPSGIAAHGGSGITLGIIEAFRQLRPQAKFLELVHRLDRETTGCLVLAKKPSVLKELHQQLLQGEVEKIYLALVKNCWEGGEKRVEASLLKNQLHSGERIVTVNKEGKTAKSIFTPIKIFTDYSLVQVKPLTGRTHQIRVHAAHIGHPIIGDDKYGDKKFNQKMRQLGAKHLLLHSASIAFSLPNYEQPIALCACLPLIFTRLLEINVARMQYGNS